MSSERTASSHRAGPRVTLELLEGAWAVSKLVADAPLPPWVNEAGCFSISRTPDELSIVGPADRVPQGVPAESPWTMFRVAGQLDFNEIGILAELTRVLAEVAISVFVVSTFNTDYILVRSADAERARASLKLAGHRWLEAPAPG